MYYDKSVTAPSRFQTLSGNNEEIVLRELGAFDGLGRFSVRRLSPRPSRTLFKRVRPTRLLARRTRRQIGRRSFVGMGNAQIYELAGMGEMHGFGKKLRKAVSRVTRVVTKPVEKIVKKAGKAIEKVTVRPLGRVGKAIEKVTVRPIGTLVRGAEKVVDSAANLTEKLADDPGSLLKIGVDAAATYAGDPRGPGNLIKSFANIGRKNEAPASDNFDAPPDEATGPELTSGGFALDQRTVMIGAGVAVGLAALYFSMKRR